jgi:hypothetical protein
MQTNPVHTPAIRTGSPGASDLRSPRRRSCATWLAVAAASLMAGLPASTTAAEAARDASLHSLDEQVQEIKSDVLAIAAELDNLEERLLYPSNTQVAVFVAVEGDDTLSIDSARISIDGELVSHHVYSWKELEALGKGGVQRIYTGNVRTGDHRIEVEVRGRRGSDKTFEIVGAGSFAKQKEPKRVGITLRPQGGDVPGIAIEDW